MRVPHDGGAVNFFGETKLSAFEDRLHEDVEKLRQRRDELRVQLDLGKMDAAEAWHDVEKRWQHLEGKLRLLASESKEVRADVAEAAGLLIEEIRDGFAKVASRL